MCMSCDPVLAISSNAKVNYRFHLGSAPKTRNKVREAKASHTYTPYHFIAAICSACAFLTCRKISFPVL